MSPWLRVLEAYLVQALLRTPVFHRIVEKVARQVHRARHGFPPEEQNGTKIDQPGGPQFTKHFIDEVKSQLGYAERKETEQTVKDLNAKIKQRKSSVVEEENSDVAWQNAQKISEKRQNAGFMQDYMDALRDQVRNKENKPPR